MQVFVSGTTGRVGDTLSQALIAQGRTVRTIALPNDRNLDATRMLGVQCVIGDLADIEAVRQAVEGADSVFHMAAVISFQPQARDAIWNANVVGTYNVLRAATEQASELRTMLDILEPLMADDEPLLLALDQHGHPHTQELVDVRDIVHGLMLIHDKPEAIDETFNLAPQTPVSLAEFIPYLAEATGRRYVTATLPVELGRTHGSGAKARAARLRAAPFAVVDEAVGHRAQTQHREARA